VVEDATVPVSYLTGAIKEVIAVAQRNQVQIAVLAHAGDGNLHPLVLCDLRDKEEMKRVDKAMDEIVDYALSVGGVLRESMASAWLKRSTRQLTPDPEPDAQLKNTFVPGILNRELLGVPVISQNIREKSTIALRGCLTPCPVINSA
jgi:FAD/FMN-containing dehydrogenase